MVLQTREQVKAPLFQPKAHARQREREARDLLERILQTSGDDENGQRGDVRLAQELALMESATEEEKHNRRQHRHENDQLARDMDRFCNQTNNYDRFLDVEGLASRIPIKSVTQQREAKLKTMKTKRDAQRRQRQELQTVLDQQQNESRAVERQLLGFNHPVPRDSAKVASAVDLLGDCDLPELTLTPQPVERLNHVQSAPTLLFNAGDCELQALKERVRTDRVVGYATRSHQRELVEQQRKLLGRATEPRPTFLSTLRLDKHEDPEASTESGPVVFDVHRNESRVPQRKSRHDEEDARMSDQQRELFLSSNFGGPRLGGGFKKAIASTAHLEVTHELDDVLAAQAVVQRRGDRRT